MAYAFAIDLLADDGRLLDRTAVTPDWNPAVEWVHWEGVRTGGLPPVTRTEPGVVEPVWDPRHGAPIVAALRVSVGGGGRSATREIPKRYVEDAVRAHAARLVARGVLEKGSTTRWLLRAAPAADPPDDADAALQVEAVARPFPLVDASLAALLERSTAVSVAASEMPVFCPPSVLDEMKERARHAGDVETGGLLVGHLHRDRDSRDDRDGAPAVFLGITAQLPAEEAAATSTRITFTPGTWAAARAAVAARGRGEQLCGWWHSHCDWCRLRNCPLERRRACTASHPFFSREDVHLHAACFPAGYHVALLVSDSAATGGLTVSAFGWSQGMVVPRGLYVLRAERDAREKGAVHAETAAS